MLARLSDHVLVVGKHPEKLAILASMGIATTLLSDSLDERAFDIVVDCTGSESGLPTALKLVRPRGTIVLKTTVAGQQTLAWAPFVIDEVTLVGSRCGPFDQALAALEQGHVQVQPLISDRFDLSRGLDALARAQTKGILKVLIDVRRVLERLASPIDDRLLTSTMIRCHRINQDRNSENQRSNPNTNDRASLLLRARAAGELAHERSRLAARELRRVCGPACSSRRTGPPGWPGTR